MTASASLLGPYESSNTADARAAYMFSGDDRAL
jgi:hypothetical protein